MGSADNPSQLEQKYGIQKFTPTGSPDVAGNFHGYTAQGVDPALMQQLALQSQGLGPSVANNAITQGASQAANANAALAGIRGNQNPGIATKSIANSLGNALQNTAGAAGTTRLGEMQGAQGALMGGSQFNAGQANTAAQYGANAAQNQAQFLEGQNEFQNTLNAGQQNELNNITSQLTLQNQANANSEMNSGLNGAINAGTSLLSGLAKLSDQNAKIGISSAGPDLSSFLSRLHSNMAEVYVAPTSIGSVPVQNNNMFDKAINSATSGINYKGLFNKSPPSSFDKESAIADNANNEGPGVQLMADGGLVTPENTPEERTVIVPDHNQLAGYDYFDSINAKKTPGQKIVESGPPVPLMKGSNGETYQPVQYGEVTWPQNTVSEQDPRVRSPIIQGESYMIRHPDGTLEKMTGPIMKAQAQTSAPVLPPLDPLNQAIEDSHGSKGSAMLSNAIRDLEPQPNEGDKSYIDARRAWADNVVKSGKAAAYGNSIENMYKAYDNAMAPSPGMPSYIGHPAMQNLFVKINPSDYAAVPKYANGGLVTSPTAIAGEDGPEAVVPLDGRVNPHEFLSKIEAKKYEYDKEHRDSPLAGKGEHFGVMAQDLEKAGPVGKSMVEDTPQGKVIDYGKGLGVFLASLADMHQRIQELEKKKGK